MVNHTLLIGTDEGLLRLFQIKRSTTMPLSTGRHASHAAVHIELLQEVQALRPAALACTRACSPCA
jgi:hypothetical protein